MEPVYRSVIGGVVATFAVQGWRVRTTGSEHVPDTGGAIVATNHIGYLDFVMSGYSVRSATPSKRLVRYAAKKETFDSPLSGALMRAMKHIPVDRGGVASQTIDESVARLRDGELVGMFPEATMSRSFVPLPAKTGAVRMAQMAGVPIIPGAIWGSQRLYAKGRKSELGTRNVAITVDWAPPMTFEPDEDPQVGTDRLMAVIAELTDQAARAYPQQPKPGDDWWVPAHLGGSAPTPQADAASAATEAEARRARRAAELAARHTDEAGTGS
ncbi:MAG: 1-acyl-sn-glycerol-3-phosphate acyltransferase [Nitriliruptoraceae bacterium]